MENITSAKGGQLVRYEEMIELLEQRLVDVSGNAETILAATVQAISETAWEEAADLRAQLPQQLGTVSPAGPGAERSLDEFLTRIGTLAGATDVTQAWDYAQASFGVIGEAITAGQLRQLMQALPEEYGALAPAVAGLTGNAETLMGEVRRLASLETMEHARVLTEAVLTVLAEATSGGQTDQLATALPQELAEWLRPGGPAQHTESERFLHEVATRSTVTDADTVRQHTGAVFKTLHQCAPEEFADTLGQLPQPLTQLAL